MLSFLQDIFSPQYKKPLVGVDIGSHSIKFSEINIKDGNSKPQLVSYGISKLPSDAFRGAMPSKKEAIGKSILDIFEEKEVETRRIAFALPSSAVFTKRISISKSAAENLATNIEFEASNYIPHRIDAINLDYQILDDSGAMTDVLLVAVKHDILDAYTEIFESAGFESVIADVESFACQNILEFAQTDLHKKIVAVIDFGYRHSTVTLLKNGIFLLAGDVGVGVRNYYDTLVAALDISMDQAGIILNGGTVPGANAALISETIDKTTETVVTDLQRQISFFWSSTGIDGLIEHIVLLGGGAHIPRVIHGVGGQLGMACSKIKLAEAFDFSAKVKESWKEEYEPVLALSLGLSLRRSGDRSLPKVKS